MRSFINRPVALAASIALTAAGLVGIASSAQAAPVKLPYDCAVSILTGQEFTLDVESNLPATLEVGSTVNAELTGTVTVGASTIGAAYGLLGGRFMEGSADITAGFGSQAVKLSANLPKTAIPSSGSLAIPLTATGSWSASTIGSQNLTISSFTAPLTLTKDDGSTSSAAVECKAKVAGTAISTTEVVAAPTETPTPTPTSTPEPSETPTPTTTPEPSETATPTTTPKPSETVTPTKTPTPTKTTEPTKPTPPKVSPVKVLVSIVVTLLGKLIKAILTKK